jgi:UDPglucose--hexose-1-phosphate uridylyltransferase
MDLVLRNNRTSEDFPHGIFHPHPYVHPVKKENIGLIEVMGLAVLPARLKDQMTAISQSVFNEQPLTEDLKDFEALAKNIEKKHTLEATLAVTQEAVGMLFVEGLCHCGVFKLNESGKEGLKRFVESIQ